MTKADKVQSYKKEFSRWLDVLSKYHSRFDENYKKYTAYNETVGTDAKISDPVAPELVERVIQKLFERDPKFYAESRGKNLPREVKNIISSTAEFLWNNPDTIQETGPMRTKLKVGGREFCVTGNIAVEAYYNAKADAPDLRIIPIEDVIFDPSKTIKTSPVYYVRQFVSLDYLKDNVEVREGGTLVKGIFKPSAVKKLEDLKKDTVRQDPTDNQINRSGGDYQKSVGDFQLISRWQGPKCVRFVMDDDLEEPILLQEYENTVLGTHPFAFAMDMEVPKQPYGFSILDFLNGLMKAKDMFLNQMVDYGSKVLNPPTIVNPNIGPVNLKTISNMYKLGGIVLGDPSQIDHKPMPPLGNFGFDMMNYIEQRAESVSGIGAYLAGVPNQSSDKTQGTKGGIEALVSQSYSPVSDRQQNIEEAIIEPIINKWMKMVGATMGEQEEKWVMITGGEAQWIRVTKGLLTGKIRLADLMTSGVLDDDNPEDAQEIMALVESMMGEGKDPQEDILFDVDWVIKVETGSMAEKDAEGEINKKKSVIEMGLQMGLPIDVEKAWKDLALDSGIKEPEQYLRKDQPQPGMVGGQMPMQGEMQGEPNAQPMEANYQPQPV